MAARLDQTLENPIRAEQKTNDPLTPWERRYRKAEIWQIPHSDNATYQDLGSHEVRYPPQFEELKWAAKIVWSRLRNHQ